MGAANPPTPPVTGQVNVTGRNDGSTAHVTVDGGDTPVWSAAVNVLNDATARVFDFAVTGDASNMTFNAVLTNTRGDAVAFAEDDMADGSLSFDLFSFPLVSDGYSLTIYVQTYDSTSREFDLTGNAFVFDGVASVILSGDLTQTVQVF